MVIVTFYVGISYNTIIMYSLYYLFSSFTAKLPWIGCDHKWNDIYCSEHYSDCVADNDGIIVDNGTCLQFENATDAMLTEYNVTEMNADGTWNLSDYTDPLKRGRVLPSAQFWK